MHSVLNRVRSVIIYYHVKYDKDNNCVCVSVHGDFQLSVMRPMIKEVRSLLTKHNSNTILNDMREAKLVESTTGTFNMPGIASKYGIKRSIKRAIVVSAISPEFKFFETVFRNQGNIVRVFDQMVEARKWLFDESSPN